MLGGKISNNSGNSSADGLHKVIEVATVCRWILLENVASKRDVLVLTLK